MSRALDVAFAGNDAWSVPSLRAVAGSRHRVSGVITFPPRPAGRGSGLRPTPVAEAARALGTPLAEVNSISATPARDTLDGAQRPDVLVVVAYGEILHRDALDAAPLGAVNVHFSLLPELRGAAPVQHALLRGLDETGVTTMRMDEGLDTGPILLQARELVRSDDDAGSLGERLASVGASLLLRTLDELADDAIEARPQADADATWAPKLTSSDRELDWREPAASVVNRVRAFAPSPGATTRFHGDALRVLRARAVDRDIDAVPGVVQVASSRSFVVAGAKGSVELLEVGPAGRRPMSGPEFVRGYRPVEGEPLG
jgi:methionyl-tRNA formyltransferase